MALYKSIREALSLLMLWWVLRWVFSWLIGSASASHKCGPGSIPSWGSDPGAVSEKALFLSELPSVLGWGR